MSPCNKSSLPRDTNVSAHEICSRQNRLHGRPVFVYLSAASMIFSTCMKSLTPTDNPKTILRFDCLGTNSLKWVPCDDTREQKPVGEYQIRSTRAVPSGLREDEEPFADCAVDSPTLKSLPPRFERSITAPADISQLCQTSCKEKYQPTAPLKLDVNWWLYKEPENAAARRVKTFAELLELLLTIDSETSVKLEELTYLCGEDCSVKRETHKGDLILVEKGGVCVAPTKEKIMRELAELQSGAQAVERLVDGLHKAERRIYDVIHPPLKRFESSSLKPSWATEDESGGLICQGIWPSSSKLLKRFTSSSKNSIPFFVNNYLVIVALKDLAEKEAIHIHDSTADADLRELIEWVHRDSRIDSQVR